MEIVVGIITIDDKDVSGVASGHTPTSHKNRVTIGNLVVEHVFILAYRTPVEYLYFVAMIIEEAES